MDYPSHPPTLATKRLILRPFELSDASRVQMLASDKRVAATTLAVPHPYEDGMAEAWIGTHAATFENREGMELAITLKEGPLIGAIGFHEMKNGHCRAGMGYWIGVDYWNRGYCTEAVMAVIHYGFSSLRLHKIAAHHSLINPASGRVMEKAGMRKEGEFVDEVLKDGKFHSIAVYGIVNRA